MPKAPRFSAPASHAALHASHDSGHTHGTGGCGSVGCGTSSRPSNTIAGALTVGALGFLLLTLSISGELTNYLRPAFIPFTIASGIALMGLSAWTCSSIQDVSPRTLFDAPMRRTSWLLLVPIALVLLSAPSPLGAAMLNSTSVGGAGGSVSASHNTQAEYRVASRVGRNEDGTIAFTPLDRSQTNQVTLEDLSNRYGFGVKDDLDGVEVSVIGFAGGQAEDPNNWRLSRFKVFCCAADALPYVVDVEGGIDSPTPDSWYEVTGVIDVEASGEVPLVRATQVRQVKQPKVPYL